MASQIGEHEFRTVVQLYHNNIALLQSGTEQGVRKPVCLCIQLCVRPDGSALRFYQGFPITEPCHIPQKTVPPCVAVFKLLPERLHRTLFFVQNAFLPHLLQKLFQMCRGSFQSLCSGRDSFSSQNHLLHFPQCCHFVLFDTAFAGGMAAGAKNGFGIFFAVHGEILLRSECKICGAVTQTAAESGQHHGLSPFYAAAADTVVQCNGDRCRRGVAVFADVQEELFHRFF